MYTYTTETQGLNTYRSYEISASEILDNVGIEMMQNNTIVGLIPMALTRMDSNYILNYNITSKITLKQYFVGSVNKERFLGVLESILDIVSKMDEYLLEPGLMIKH